MLDPPTGVELPPRGFDVEDAGFQAPAEDGSGIQVVVDPNSDRIQLLEPFRPITQESLTDMRVLIKAKGKCTTDHISMAGPWLTYRGHLENISENCLIGAINYFNGETNKVANFANERLNVGSVSGAAPVYMPVPQSARTYRDAGIGTVVFGEENYGEGSSREHAAMEPRFLGVNAVVVKSFARIHETNLKKQGMLGLTFADPGDYDLVRQDDKITILDLDKFTPGKALEMRLDHVDGTSDTIKLNHTYNQAQIEWVKAGSALNKIRADVAAGVAA